MREVIAISVGEIILKGGNRAMFENELISRIKRALEGLNVDRVYKEMAKIYVEVADDQIEEAINRLKYVFGIIYITRTIRVEKDEDTDISIDNAKRAVDEALKNKSIDIPFSFKIIASRADKSFPLKSPQLNPLFGGYVLKNYEHSSVDVHNPDIPIYVEIREHIYVSTERIRALGGMPMGTNGKGLLLLSGGIDSPVAGFSMARRGMAVDGLHFHSYPYTSAQAEDKVIRLAKEVAKFTGRMQVHSVNILPVQQEIKKHCQEKNNTILFRRMMMRVAKAYSKRYNYDCVITGDNLGQVASQTIKAMKIIDKTTDQLKVRPLISFDKEQIIKIAKDIGTYDISIEPFDDSCTVFAPKSPNLNPTLEEILEEESRLDIEGLVKTVIDNAKTIKID